MTNTIFECEFGSVWKAVGNYGTLKAGHMLVVEMAKEIEKLRERVAKLEFEIAAEDEAHAWVQDYAPPEVTE
jgi:phage tail tape-measure protein